MTSSSTTTWVGVAARLLALGVAGSALGSALLLRPDLVFVEHVVFDGNDRAGPGALRHLANLKNGTTMWAVDLDEVAAGVQRHPWVRGARATRAWPDTIVVEVEEHDPVALLHYDGTLHYVDADGMPFLAGVVDDLNYPSITGLDAQLERSHPDLPKLVIRDALLLLRELDNRGLAPTSEVSEVAFSPTAGFTVHAGEARLVFGLTELHRQLARLAALVERGQVDLSRRELVDLAPATVAIVRPLPPPAGS